MEKISAIIPCFNEEKNIRKAIESVLFADEILVVDSFSTDTTIDIIEEMQKEHSKIRFFQHEYVYSAAQKNWIIPQATHDWIFLLDADERTDNKLIEEIYQTINNSNNVHVGFWIKRDNYFMDKKLNHVWKGDAVIRLFRKNKCEYEDKHVHAEIKSTGSIGKLKHHLKHDTYFGKGLNGHLKKGERYTTWAALDRVNKIKRITLYHLLIKPSFGFLKRYILQQGFLDGKVGFIISCLGAWNIFIRNVKIMRMHQGEEFPKE